MVKKRLINDEPFLLLFRVANYIINARKKIFGLEGLFRFVRSNRLALKLALLS